MAAIKVPASEARTEYGPCLDEGCGHRHCEAAREHAAFTCGVCERPIGYERMHYLGTEEYADAHQGCFIRAVEDARPGDGAR